MSELTIVLKVAIEPNAVTESDAVARAEIVRFDTDESGEERSAVVLLRIGAIA